MGSLKLPAKVFWLILDLVRKQNEDLLKIIAEEEGLPYQSLIKLIPTEAEIRRMIYASSSSSEESSE